MSVQIGELVWKLNGDTRNFDSSVSKTDAGMKKTGDTATKLKGLIIGAFSAAAVIGALKAFTSFLKGASEAAAVQEAAVTRLGAALAVTGQDVDAVLPGMQAFASEMQRLTVIGDETSLGLLQTATNMGLQGQAAQEATKQAIALSRAYGIDLDTALLGVVNTIQGQTSTLTRYIPSLKSAGDATERLAILNDEANKAWAIATAEVDSASGSLAQLQNALGDTRELIGQQINETLTPWRQSLLSVATAYNEILTQGNFLKESLRDAKDGVADFDQQIAIIEARLARGGLTRGQREEQEALILNLKRLRDLEAGRAAMRAQTAREEQARLDNAEASRALALENEKLAGDERIAEAERVAQAILAAEEYLAANTIANQQAIAEFKESNARDSARAMNAYLQQEVEDARVAAEQLIAIQMAQLESASMFFGALSDLAELAGEKNRGFAILAKGLASAQAAINSYLAFTQVLADPFYIGRPFLRVINAATILAAGIAQQVKILGTGIPAFQFGGVVPGGSFSGDTQIARVNSGEEILTRDDPRHVNNGGRGGGVIQNTIILDGRVIAQNTVDYLDNGKVRSRALMR